jgi:hypothetical protein
MLRRAVSVAFIISILLIGSRGQNQDEAEANRNREAFIARTKEGSLRPILEVLDKANLSGSLEFSGRCESLGVQDFPEFPKFRVPATSGGSPLQTLREILSDDPSMQVTQDPDGTIRMIESGVPTDILNVKIGHVTFENSGISGQHGVYSANWALYLIFEAPEVAAFMKAHDIEWPFAVFGPLSGIIGKTPLPPSVPHISGSMDNLTFSEAMDRVVKTFPGIWIYENCPRSDTKKRLVYLHIYETPFHFFHVKKSGL